MDIDSAQIPPLMTLPKTQATYVAESQVPETESQVSQTNDPNRNLPRV